MTDIKTATDQRITIAQEVGWKFVHLNEGSTYWAHIVRIDDPEGKTCGGYDGDVPKFKKGQRVEEYHARRAQDIERAGIPDYLNNRDAIVQAIIERFTTDEQQGDFAQKLRLSVKPHGYDAFCYATATARQMAEAFLDAVSSPVDG